MVRIFCRLWYNCGQTKNHRRIGGDFSRNGGPNRDRTDDLTDANRTLSQLSYRPILLLFAGFCNKKQIFMFFNFRRFRRKFSPKLWTETRRSMCDHRDANRTLSQLSYKPEYEIVPRLPHFVRRKAQITCVPHYYTHFREKSKRKFSQRHIISRNERKYQNCIFYLCGFCGIIRLLCGSTLLRRGRRQILKKIGEF